MPCSCVRVAASCETPRALSHDAAPRVVRGELEGRLGRWLPYLFNGTVGRFRNWLTAKRARKSFSIDLEGMPKVRDLGSTISAAGRIPTLLFYAPVLVHCFRLAWRHRSVTLPAVANPHIESGGFFGESKFSYLKQIPERHQRWIAPSICIRIAHACSPPALLAIAENAMAEKGLSYPLVVKPDIGSQGYGVRLVPGPAELTVYLADYPKGEHLILQEFIPWPGEAGVLYVRIPEQPRGHIFSLGFRYFPHVVGDGRSNLGQLLERDLRTARSVAHLRRALRTRIREVPSKGEIVRLSLVGAVRVGGVYRDGNAHITDPLTARFDELARSMPDFHFGRFDIRFKSLEALMQGDDIRVLEVNGVGAEAIHIWDPELSIAITYRTLFKQFELLYEIGARNRARGHRPPRLSSILGSVWREARLLQKYPPSN